MNCLSKLQKVLLCAGLVLIVAALFGAPKYWDYCEMQALEDSFARLVDVENWSSTAEIRVDFPAKTLQAEQIIHITAAVKQLEFDGRHTEQRYAKYMAASGNDFTSVTVRIMHKMKGGWFIEVYANGYCVVDGDYVVKNSADLYRTLESILTPDPNA